MKNEKYNVVVGKLGPWIKEYVFPGECLGSIWRKKGIDDLLQEYKTNIVNVGSTVTQE